MHDTTTVYFRSDACYAVSGSDCSATHSSDHPTSSLSGFERFPVAAGACVQKVSVDTLAECERKCMDSRLGCKSFNFVPLARVADMANRDIILWDNCEFTPNSASVPDHLSTAPNNRGFTHV